MPRHGGYNPTGVVSAKPKIVLKGQNNAETPSGYSPSLKEPNLDWPDQTRVQYLLRTVVVDVLGTQAPVPFKAQIRNSQELYSIMRVWIVSYGREFGMKGELGYQMFRSHWRTYRLVIPLQLRLICEQALYDLDAPWRRLVTGFKPVYDG